MEIIFHKEPLVHKMVHFRALYLEDHKMVHFRALYLEDHKHSGSQISWVLSISIRFSLNVISSVLPTTFYRRKGFSDFLHLCFGLRGVCDGSLTLLGGGGRRRNPFIFKMGAVFFFFFFSIKSNK